MLYLTSSSVSILILLIILNFFCYVQFYINHTVPLDDVMLILRHFSNDLQAQTHFATSLFAGASQHFKLRMSFLMNTNGAFIEF